MLSRPSTNPRVAEILALEQLRCNAIVARDVEALRALLTDDLVHTHTRGNTQSLAEYLDYVTQQMVFRSVERSDLKVKINGDTAIVTGKLTNTVRMQASKDFVRVEAQVLQVWVCWGQSWRQAAFQATALGPPVVLGAMD